MYDDLYYFYYNYRFLKKRILIFIYKNFYFDMFDFNENENR